MDDENKDQEQQNNLIRRNADQINDAIRKKVKENAKKNAAAKSKIAAASGPVIFWGVVIIVAIIVIIGIIMFLITMPGMVMDKIKSIGKTIADGWHSWWGRDDAKNVTDEEIYKALDYLDEMGYDLKGFGFLTDYVEGEKKGFKVDDDNKIVKATSDFIKVYLASDNYVYTLKNHNLVAGTWDAFVQHVGQFFGGSFSTKLTRGLIAVYKERGGVLGQRESSLFSDSGLFNGDKMKLDVKAKTLTLRKGFNNKELTYSLDGWTGRYGMPVDFLMSVHVATMMPDLAYDMANHFDTEIELILHGVSNSSIQPAYKTEDGTYVTFDDIAQGANQTGILQDPIEWLRDKVGTSNFTDEEAQATMADFKITNINSENQTDAEFMTELLGRLDRERDNNFHYYIPYIGRVKNHWYRDVYYAITNDSTELVKVDYDYESKFKERWTIYETYTKNEDPERAGEFKIYALNKNGGYATSAEDIENYSPEIFVKEPETGYFLFRGSTEDQKKALQGEDITGVRYNVAKKAKTLNSTNTSELEDLGWHEDAGTWSAYKKEGSITTAWERLYPESEDPIEQRIYIRVGGATNIKQTGEGQRGETNPDIKKMFLVNEYFRYDGTQETAEAITALRKKLKSDIVENDGSEYGPLNELPYKKGAFKDVRDLSYTATELGINGSASKIMQEDDDGKLVEVDREYKISDFIGKVTINQDSLNAFSMLENTHTLDSDYIYRDFKELIVELGYFEKEELTDEIPRLLEFPVPEIGSYNYPKREIDKRENEYGTMIHSKGDIDAYKALSLKQYLEDFEISEGEYQETHEPYEHFTVDDREFYFDEGGKLHPVDPTQFTEGEHVWIQSKEYVFYGGEFILVEKEPQEEEPHPHEGRDEDYEEEEEEEEEIELDVSGIDTSNIGTDLGATIANVLEKADELQKINSSLDMVETSDTSNDNISHAITTELGGPASFEVQINCTAEEFCEYAAQVHAVMENSAWGYCNGRSDHGPSNGHTEHGVYTTQAKAEAGRKTVDCSTFVCWVLQAAGVVPEGWRTNSHGLINTPEFQPYLLTREDAGEPQPGDILLMDYKGVNGHAQINGEDNIQYNCGGTAAIRSKPKKSRAFIDGTSSNPDHKYEYILRLFSSNTKKANPYEGYKGNDAVVSPVTGILLEYGTYTNEDMDSISQEQYRVNVDLKYGPLIESPKVERQIISDKVGYAKILVLDADTYQKIESELIKHSSEAFRREVGDSLLLESGKFKDLDSITDQSRYEDITKMLSKIWNNYDETIYGYKEFVKSYMEAGIDGNIIYIDGFLPEMPDKEFDNKKDLRKKVPYEDDDSARAKATFTIEETTEGISFKSIKTEDLSKDSKKKQLESIYYPDEKHKFASQKATNAYKAKTKIKEDAYSSVYCYSEDDLIVLKEGTIIGRTMTDKELLEDKNIREATMKYRPEETSLADVTFDIARPKSKGEEALIIGNYIRVIMRDGDKTPVENVEDYMKLDPNKDKNLGDIEKLMTWQALEPEGFHFYSIPGVKGGKDINIYQDGHLCIRQNPSDVYGYDWVICNGGNADPNLCPGIFMGWPGKSPNFGGKKVMEVCGYSYAKITNGQYDSWVTGKQLLEIYTAELEHEVEKIKREINKLGGDGEAVIEQLNQDQINALIDVIYKGQGYMNGKAPLNKAPYAGHRCSATLLKKLAKGQINQINLYDFVDTNPNHPKRRIADYLMFRDGTYMAHVNNCSYEARFTDKYQNPKTAWSTYYEFISDAPFQDLMRRVQPVEEVEWTGTYEYPW